MSFASRANQSGFTLIELMISTVIGLLMISALLTAYVANSLNYRMQEAMSEVQEIGRFVLNQTAYDLRNAGLGAAANEMAVVGFVNADAAYADTNGKDVLLAKKDKISSPVLYIPVHDEGGDIAYYIANLGVGDSLYRYDPAVHKSKPQAIVSGVRQIALEYGVDGNSDQVVDSFELVGDVKNWARVVAVRVSFLVSSTEQVLKKKQTLPDPFVINDRALYRIFTTTVVLRNKVL